MKNVAQQCIVTMPLDVNFATMPLDVNFAIQMSTVNMVRQHGLREEHQLVQWNNIQKYPTVFVNAIEHGQVAWVQGRA